MIKSNDPENLKDFLDNKITKNVDSMEFKTEYNDNFVAGFASNDIR